MKTASKQTNRRAGRIVNDLNLSVAASMNLVVYAQVVAQLGGETQAALGQLLGPRLLIAMMADDGELPERIGQQCRLVITGGGLHGSIERYRSLGQCAGPRMGFAGGQQLNCPPRANGAGS